jgi:hypothetical protein
VAGVLRAGPRDARSRRNKAPDRRPAATPCRTAVAASAPAVRTWLWPAQASRGSTRPWRSSLGCARAPLRARLYGLVEGLIIHRGCSSVRGGGFSVSPLVVESVAFDYPITGGESCCSNLVWGRCSAHTGQVLRDAAAYVRLEQRCRKPSRALRSRAGFHRKPCRVVLEPNGWREPQMSRRPCASRFTRSHDCASRSGGG